MQCVTKSECDIVPSYPSWKKIQNDQGFWSNTVTNKTGLEQLPKRFYKKPCKHMQNRMVSEEFLPPEQFKQSENTGAGILLLWDKVKMKLPL